MCLYCCITETSQKNIDAVSGDDDALNVERQRC
jgi:hypothetical protein